MVREAFNAESDKDFIHKLSIGQKEIGETIYWLELLEATDYISNEEFVSIPYRCRGNNEINQKLHHHQKEKNGLIKHHAYRSCWFIDNVDALIPKSADSLVSYPSKLSADNSKSSR